METPIAPTRAARRAASLLAPVAMLLLALAFSAGARASVTGPHGSSAARRSAKSGRHGRRHGRKHHAHHHAAHKPKKSAKHTTSPAYELVPAACEDGSLPSHSGGGSYSCEDGSAPSCEEGTLRTSASSAPMCAVKASSGEDECSREGGECTAEVEFDCEDPLGTEATAHCERSEEEEPPEEEEE